MDIAAVLATIFTVLVGLGAAWLLRSSIGRFVLSLLVTMAGVVGLAYSGGYADARTKAVHIALQHYKGLGGVGEVQRYSSMIDELIKLNLPGWLTMISIYMLLGGIACSVFSFFYCQLPADKQREKGQQQAGGKSEKENE